MTIKNSKLLISVGEGGQRHPTLPLLNSLRWYSCPQHVYNYLPLSFKIPLGYTVHFGTPTI